MKKPKGFLGFSKVGPAWWGGGLQDEAGDKFMLIGWLVVD